MKITDVQLSEGLIKVPERLAKVADSALVSTILSIAYSEIEDIAGSGSTPANKFRLWARKTYPGARIRYMNSEDEIPAVALPSLSSKDFDPKYAKWVKGHLDVPTLAFTTEGDAGGYDGDTDTISVSLERLLGMDWDLYCRAAMAGGPKGEKATNEILARLGDLITSFRGYLKHELMHYIQFNVLNQAHPAQVDYDNEPSDEDSYYGSQTEFDPQIESAVANTVALIAKLHRNVNNVDFRNVASFVTGATPRERLVQALGTDKMLPAEGSKFFEVLKRKDPEAWKRAVKKFYSTLADRLS